MSDTAGARRMFCWRFDVDTHRCMLQGVPNLLRMASRHNVHFTFFVNMGRLTSRRLLATQALARGGSAGAAGTGGAGGVHKLPLRRKLGTAGYARVLLGNPLVGSRALGLIGQAQAAGHEIGLHGGRNHRLWQSQAPGWPADRVRDELAYGCVLLRAAGVEHAAGFSSPGWSGSEEINAVLAESFTYVADIHGGQWGGPVAKVGPLTQVATNILGEPGGVGYLEWHRAQGHDDAQVLADFRDRLDRSGPYAVAYDHPFWAGISDLAMTEQMVVAAQERGFEVALLRDIAAAAPAGGRASDHG